MRVRPGGVSGTGPGNGGVTAGAERGRRIRTGSHASPEALPADVRLTMNSATPSYAGAIPLRKVSVRRPYDSELPTGCAARGERTFANDAARARARAASARGVADHCSATD